MEHLKTIKKIIFTAELAENAEKGQLFSRLRRKKQIQTPWDCPPVDSPLRSLRLKKIIGVISLNGFVE